MYQTFGEVAPPPSPGITYHNICFASLLTLNVQLSFKSIYFYIYNHFYSNCYNIRNTS